MRIRSGRHEGDEISAMRRDKENGVPSEEDNALREVLEALIVTLKQCRIAIGLYGDRDGAESTPEDEDIYSAAVTNNSSA